GASSRREGATRARTVRADAHTAFGEDRKRIARTRGAGRQSPDIQAGGPVDLASLAYTLQVGREAMEHRVIFLVRDVAELIQKLRAFNSREREIEGCWTGRVGARALTDSSGHSGQEPPPEFAELAQAWCRGVAVEWTSMYHKETPRRISLPTYPFA